MREVDEWLRAEVKNIEDDPSFMIETSVSDEVAFPWEDLEIRIPEEVEGERQDTARVSISAGGVDARWPIMIYAHLHLMSRSDRLEEWLPEAVGKTGFELERAILARTSDAWLYVRAILDAGPYEPMDELLYSTEHGYLDALILTARGDEFSEEREAWLAREPDALEEFREWYQDTFSKDPPGLKSEG
jgi:hypothetical protein